MDLKINGKSAIVTGGAQGLGKAVCQCLASEGVNVAVNYRSSADKAQETVNEIKAAYGVDAFAIQADITAEQDVRNLFAAAKERFGALDIMVNNSGVCPITMIKDTSYEEWKMVIDTNLSGTFLTNREMVNTLIDSGRSGAIVNIVSSAAFIGSKRGKTAYSASKGGVVTFTHSLAKEIAQYGIRVNSVAPGLMYTTMTAEVLDAEEDKYNKTIPIGRIGTVEEVARMVVLTASDVSAYITGALVDVTGGMISR